MIGRRLCVLGAVLAVASCEAESPVSVSMPPGIETSSVAPNPHNVLSAMVRVRVLRADSVAVRYGIRGADLDASTPSTEVTEMAALLVLPVMGLRAGTEYALQVVAWGGAVVAGDTLMLVTGQVPADLPTYAARGSDPSPGYVVLAAGAYGIVVDNQGDVVWYRHFPSGPGLNFQAQPNGRYAARPQPTDPSRPGPWVEVDPLGAITRVLGCTGDMQPRFHDLVALPDGSYWVLCDEQRVLDLSEMGGGSAVPVTGTNVQYLSGDGSVLFQWSPFEHFELPLPDGGDPDLPINWTHGNALDLDVDSNLLVSFRNLNEITKIDTRTGEVLWRMGGPYSDFVFQNTPPFAGQHGLRATGAGRFVLLDNLGDPGGSRAERYTYDAASRTTHLDASYGSLPPVVAHLGGTTQDLPGGRTLVSFGNAGRVEEYDAAGDVVWWMEAPGYVFRAQRIQSLYGPGAGSSR